MAGIDPAIAHNADDRARHLGLDLGYQAQSALTIDFETELSANSATRSDTECGSEALP